MIAKTFAWLKEVYHGEPPYEATPEVTAESEAQALPKEAAKGGSKSSKGKSKAEWGYAYRRAKAKESNSSKSGGNHGEDGSNFVSFGAEAGGLGESGEASSSVCPSISTFGRRSGAEVKPCRAHQEFGSTAEDFRSAFDSPRNYAAGDLGCGGESPVMGASSGMEKAMLAQSAALTSLVAHLASSSGDPLADLTHGTTTGTKGAAGRARLQAELASHSGSFFNAVMKSMALRMSPTSSAEISHESMMQAGISLTRYLERFGGYGRCRDLGLVQYQVMSAMDFLQVGNYGAAKDVVALLAVMLEQAVLDGGRFEVAQVLTLQEDVPYTVFSARQGSVARRAFAPLADQRWATVALAYLKELETISSKRVEMLSSQTSAAGGGAGNQMVPVPKQKAAVKKKPRRGAGAQDGEEEAE